MTHETHSAVVSTCDSLKQNWPKHLKGIIMLSLSNQSLVFFNRDNYCCGVPGGFFFRRLPDPLSTYGARRNCARPMMASIRALWSIERRPKSNMRDSLVWCSEFLELAKILIVQFFASIHSTLQSGVESIWTPHRWINERNHWTIIYRLGGWRFRQLEFPLLVWC